MTSFFISVFVQRAGLWSAKRVKKKQKNRHPLIWNSQTDPLWASIEDSGERSGFCLAVPGGLFHAGTYLAHATEITVHHSSLLGEFQCLVKGTTETYVTLVGINLLPYILFQMKTFEPYSVSNITLFKITNKKTVCYPSESNHGQICFMALR